MNAKFREDVNPVQWYVMRAYKCERKVETLLREQNEMEYFIPKHDVLRTCHGRKIKMTVPLIPGLIFVRACRSQIVQFKKKHNFLQYAMCKSQEGNRCMIVPDRQMEHFIRVSMSRELQATYYRLDELNLPKGSRIRIHGGQLDGVEGIYVKVKGKRNRRIVVVLDGIMAVGAEVHADYIEKL